MFEKRVVKENDKKDAGSSTMNKSVRPEKGSNSGGSLVSITAIVVPLILAVIVTGIIFVIVKKQNTSKVIEQDVVVAIKPIPANTYICKDEMKDYFDTVRVDVRTVSENAVANVKDLPESGFYVRYSLKEKQMLYTEDIMKSDVSLDKYKEGYQTTSVAVEDFDNSVAGTIRKGNVVDIYAVDPTDDTMKLMAENVYVLAAYDNAGVEINGEVVATAFTIMVAESEKESVNKAITYGGIQLYLSEE